MKGYWTCQRQTRGVKCGASNPNRLRKCVKCHKPRPARKRPAHMAALDLTYEQYIELNGGEHCGICGKPPSPTRKLDRDHCHRSATPRGLLCWQDNKQLRGYMTVEWLEKAIAYLKRAERTHA